MRVVFAGTPDFGAATLTALLAAAFDVVGVYTQPDRPAGRGRRVRAGPVKAIATERGLSIEQPTTLRGEPAVTTLAAYRPDVMVVAAYGLILPPAILALPTYGCINVHASLLPRWRGAAPIQRAIIAGDAQAGITIMQMDVGLDTGDMLSIRRCPIEGHDTGGSLHDKLAALGATALLDTLTKCESGELCSSPQPEQGVTYARRIETFEARLDWKTSAIELERVIRGFNPWPVARTQFGDIDLRIWEAIALACDTTSTPGQVLDVTSSGIDVGTAQGVLRLVRLQRPGGKPLAVREFLNGMPITTGDSFGDAG
jgi:methionyl-tRNA formyltransferase